MSTPSLFQRAVSENLRRDLIEIAAAVDAGEPSFVLDALLLRARVEMRRSFGSSERMETWFRAIESEDGFVEPVARRQVFGAHVFDHV